MHRTIMVAIFLYSVFCLQCARAGQYRHLPYETDQDKGLLVSRVDSVGMEDRQYRHSKNEEFTPEKVKLDLVGWSVGPEAVVRVRPGVPGSAGAASGPSAGAHGKRSFDVYVPVPLGIVFDQTNIMDIEILDVMRDGDRAALIVHVGTVSSQAGKLKLGYRHVANEWVLQQVENVSFRAR